jgi:hypothetical protein
MKVFFGGAEKGTYRKMLLTAGVTRHALNLTHFPIPKKKELDLSALFDEGEIIVYTSENDEDTNRFDQFVRDHADSLHIVIGRPDYEGSWLGEKYYPLWNDEQDLERLTWLCQKYGRAAISDKAVTGRNVGRIASIAQRWNAKLVGITSKPDLIERVPWDSVIVGSWTSAIRYGETQVWDGHGLRRYPAQQKESSRRKHRADIVRLGIDFDAVMDDNVSAIGNLAIASWQQWETHTFGGYDPMNDDDEQEILTPNEGQIVAIPPVTHTPTSLVSGGSTIAINTPTKRHESERVLLPVMGMETITSFGSQTVDTEGDSIEIDPEKVNVIRYNANPLRQCDSCYLSNRCPSFKEHSECAFNLPIEIRTKDQLQAAMRALLEMQVGRVMFARFAEELEGQGLDPALSSEMDRLFNLIDRFKNISDTRDTIRLEMEARGSSGVLSRLFGAKAGETSRMLEGGGMGAQATNALYADVLDLSDDN